MKPGTGKKVLVAMSGGVDSSVVAALLQDEGYDVVGCFMRLGSEDSVEAVEGPDPLACDPAKIKANKQGCCSVNDASDARLVAAMLGVPFYVLNFKKDFGRIIDYFVAEYNDGRTPNPCVRCNDWLKFGKLFGYAASIDADYVATGHYARVKHGPTPQLLMGANKGKDQSYVLFGTKLDRLQHMMLPIGEHESKDLVRQVAEDRGLPVFNKPDSQEICFVPDNDYARLVKKRSPETFAKGRIVDTEGNELGEHEGHQHYTIGQRRGVGVALGYPIYVVDKQAESNTITVGAREDLLSAGLRADQTNWLIDPPLEDRACTIRIRSNSAPVPGTMRAVGDDGLEVMFNEPQAAVSPGQAVVAYDGDRVLGGGWIREATR